MEYGLFVYFSIAAGAFGYYYGAGELEGEGIDTFLLVFILCFFWPVIIITNLYEETD